jgi:hypothetical protein
VAIISSRWCSVRALALECLRAIGSVPLPVLEQRMVQFIADEGAAPKE